MQFNKTAVHNGMKIAAKWNALKTRLSFTFSSMVGYPTLLFNRKKDDILIEIYAACACVLMRTQHHPKNPMEYIGVSSMLLDIISEPGMSTYVKRKMKSQRDDVFFIVQETSRIAFAITESTNMKEQGTSVKFKDDIDNLNERITTFLHTKPEHLTRKINHMALRFHNQTSMKERFKNLMS